MTGTSGGRAERWLSPGVLGVGGASFFSDAGHEMVTSLLPTFLTSTLHSGPASLGIIDGVSDSLIGISKLAGGPLANDPGRRSRLVSSGYVGTAVATAGIGLCVAVWQVAVLRAAAWSARGIRSPARDMLLTSITPRSAYGRATGLERAGDNAGAVVGPLLASLLVGLIGIRHTILLAVLPGVLAALAITIAARQARLTITSPVARRTLVFNFRGLWNAGLPKAITPALLFEFGNLATTLLILRATDLLEGGGHSLTAATTVAILLYAAHNGAATIASLAGGQLADRCNPRIVLAAGASVYVLSYLIFASEEHAWPVLLLGFVLAGFGIGFAETAESTTVALALSDDLRANGFGVLGLVQSVGDLVASALGGLLWAVFSAPVAFVYAGSWMLASIVAAGLRCPSAARTGPPDQG